ncbi:hypothetical protein UNDYM_3112 [Undibacterium sp. YM2]|nr:hypothetical protein UNDKW_3039 [Undibacterium sp. KW1]BBB67365.1 hypothetical protein UNDYM_3112 [Undibacterium sp. YM2]
MSATAALTPTDLPLVGATDSTPDVVDGLAFAKLYGEPLFKLPTDLYIPPTRWKYSWRHLKARWICCCT